MRIPCTGRRDTNRLESSKVQRTLMYRILAIIIGLVFLAYGLLRLGVGSALLLQDLGYLDIAALEEPLRDVGDFLAKKEDKQLITVNVAGYAGYIALMGLTLTIGAVGSLANRSRGLFFIAAFLLMYVALFVNFQTVNPKIYHLAVAFVLFLVLAWARRQPPS